MTRPKQIVLVFALCFVAGIVLKLYQDRNPTAAQLRKNMSLSAHSSCLDHAHQTANGRSSTPQQVNRYCDCVTSKAIDPLSDAELRDAAARGVNPSPDDLTRIRGIAQLCNAEVYGLR